MFKFRLALALGRTIQEIDEGMSSSEFNQWLAYYHLEPFGAERDNFHSATIATVLANIHRGKSQPPFSTEDFMLRDSETRAKSETKKTLLLLDALSNANTARNRNSKTTGRK